MTCFLCKKKCFSLFWCHFSCEREREDNKKVKNSEKTEINNVFYCCIVMMKFLALYFLFGKKLLEMRKLNIKMELRNTKNF